MARALGLDVGTKTIGLALSDETGIIAFPLLTVARRGLLHDIAAVVRIASEHRVGLFVVGLPFELDGSEARSARLARQIGDALAAASRRPVRYVDERFTSVEAERLLIAAGVSRTRRKATIDQAAAALILQAWLDHGETVSEGGHGEIDAGSEGG